APEDQHPGPDHDQRPQPPRVGEPVRRQLPRPDEERDRTQRDQDERPEEQTTTNAHGASPPKDVTLTSSPTDAIPASAIRHAASSSSSGCRIALRSSDHAVARDLGSAFFGALYDNRLVVAGAGVVAAVVI